MSDYEDVVKNIMSQICGTNVQAIFGESRQIGDKVVIPVGKISYGWGSGGGKGKCKEREEGKNEGEGFGIGMGVKVIPMGFITVTADRVAYDPIIDYGPIIAMGGMILALASLKLFKVMAIIAVKKHHHKGKFHT